MSHKKFKQLLSNATKPVAAVTAPVQAVVAPKVYNPFVAAKPTTKGGSGINLPFSNRRRKKNNKVY